ncbi:CRC domain-containing protein TSO1 isoform X2 [Quercus suber]|uniref:CRC domain-containing protein TSO1 isoform X2 n=1 Tax=Quercus suber TaxID=58331 RepID=UPI0032DF5C4F
MSSPECNRVAATSSPSSSNKSPPVQESPFSNFLSNLSPIKSVKAVRYTQRFLESNFPTPPPVFTSPRIDLQRETGLLERNNIVEEDSNIREQCNTQLNVAQIPSLEKEVQSCSPSGSVDEYLADIVEVDCTHSAHKQLQLANEVSQMLQGGFTDPKETIRKVDTEHGRGSREARTLTSSDQAEQNLPLTSLNLVDDLVDLRNDESFNVFLKITSEDVNDIVDPDVNLNPALGAQQNEQYAAQEANHHQRGIRRHLHFEAALACKSVATGNATNSRASLTNLKGLGLSHVESRATSSGREAVNHAQSRASKSSFSPFEVVRSTQNSRNPVILSPIPSGMGLHLNSTVRSVSLGTDMFASKNLTRYRSSQDKVVSERSNDSAEDPNSTSISAVAGTMYSYADIDQQESQAGVAASSDTYPINSLNPPCDSPLAQTEQKVIPCEGRISTPQNADSVEELNEESSNKKRKRPSNTSESHGCKRCNCKRSKCLKLYCECFAAGVYCVDSCACINCFNKPEYEYTVLDIRQQIESRNPLAFAPKVVKHDTDSPAIIMEAGNRNTPSSARHKRGCNCKKSKCLKKYCECYQANVGCSNGCRCEGCQNSFGTSSECRRVENPSHEVSGKDGSIEQFSPTWQGLADIRSLAPCSGALMFASSNIRDCSKVSQTKLQRGSSIQPQAGSLQWNYSPVILTPQLRDSKGSHELTSDSALCDIMEEEDMREILKDTSTPLKAVKASSLNQKQVMPPHYRSDSQRSSSPHGTRSVRKFILQTMPPFPPLTPYSNSKGRVNQKENDQKDNIGNH